VRPVQVFFAALPQHAKENVMERTEDVIELGTATVETKGPFGQGLDDAKRQAQAGLSDD
jgi:hypothetical protein